MARIAASMNFPPFPTRGRWPKRKLLRTRRGKKKLRRRPQTLPSLMTKASAFSCSSSSRTTLGCTGSFGATTKTTRNGRTSRRRSPVCSASCAVSAVLHSLTLCFHILCCAYGLLDMWWCWVGFVTILRKKSFKNRQTKTVIFVNTQMFFVLFWRFCVVLTVVSNKNEKEGRWSLRRLYSSLCSPHEKVLSRVYGKGWPPYVSFRQSIVFNYNFRLAKHFKNTSLNEMTNYSTIPPEKTFYDSCFIYLFRLAH